MTALPRQSIAIAEPSALAQLYLSSKADVLLGPRLRPDPARCTSSTPTSAGYVVFNGSTGGENCVERVGPAINTKRRSGLDRADSFVTGIWKSEEHVLFTMSFGGSFRRVRTCTKGQPGILRRTAAGDPISQRIATCPGLRKYLHRMEKFSCAPRPGDLDRVPRKALIPKLSKT
ncbi:unnamed protein product [Nezara viridula]|uniref:Uncharacterized protein n=1 Tax=Nezara viridula TaxID=85310 RepID=A0A9P0H444_NEZVI|nr:unnamed protein product [Nezara viridula]